MRLKYILLCLVVALGASAIERDQFTVLDRKAYFKVYSDVDGGFESYRMKGVFIMKPVSLWGEAIPRPVEREILDFMGAGNAATINIFAEQAIATPENTAQDKFTLVEELDATWGFMKEEYTSLEASKLDKDNYLFKFNRFYTFILPRQKQSWTEGRLITLEDLIEPSKKAEFISFLNEKVDQNALNNEDMARAVRENNLWFTRIPRAVYLGTDGLNFEVWSPRGIPFDPEEAARYENAWAPFVYYSDMKRFMKPEAIRYFRVTDPITY